MADSKGIPTYGKAIANATYMEMGGLVLGTIAYQVSKAYHKMHIRDASDNQAESFEKGGHGLFQTVAQFIDQYPYAIPTAFTIFAGLILFGGIRAAKQYRAAQKAKESTTPETLYTEAKSEPKIQQ